MCIYQKNLKFGMIYIYIFIMNIKIKSITNNGWMVFIVHFKKMHLLKNMN